MDFKKSRDLNIAVIGSGISGICAAYLLQHRHKITLFEKNDYFGGHTNTVLIQDGPDAGTPVDTGFIVLNERTYPNFIQFLSQLKVEKSRTDMSFSYHCKRTRLSYANQNLNTLFAQRSNLFKPSFLRFVREMIQYLKILRKEYLAGQLPDCTLLDYVRQKGLHQEVVEWFIIPMAAAIWSGSDFQMGSFPIQTFAQFYENHGLLGITGHPPWYFVKGGSHIYVKAFLKSFKGTAVKDSPVLRVSRADGQVTLHFKSAPSQTFDAVIIAVHADQALRLLENPDAREKKLLGAWTYSKNKTFLHSDSNVMPPARRAWASWNYTRFPESDVNSPVMVSYDMKRLQKLETLRPYFVTLNPQHPIPQEHIIKEIDYTHPQYSFEAFNTQQHLQEINGVHNTFYCGSYFGYGFHEDGVKSALMVGEKFGAAL